MAKHNHVVSATFKSRISFVYSVNQYDMSVNIVFCVWWAVYLEI